MVSLRRRKNLGLCSGKISFPIELPRLDENGNAVKSPRRNIKTSSMHPMSSFSSFHQKMVHISEACAGSSNITDFSTSKNEPNHRFQGKQIKGRKRRRGKHNRNQEQYPMRGVYFKNTKWRAAIKVDQKQIHLGTLGSQEEAARLYDRAAFMCGRPTNFELSEEEKQELRQYKWDEFLAQARSGVATRELHVKQKKSATPLQSSDQENGDTDLSSVPDDVEDEDGDGDGDGDGDADADTSVSQPL